MSGADTDSIRSEAIEEMVVLLNETGDAIGAEHKKTVHHAHTPLHLAFSCYLFNDDGEVLLSRRSLSKATWPGTWTNSFCGHPTPGEPVGAAVKRRARQELGIEIEHLRLVNSQFQYRAIDHNGIVENELCPVYRATLSGAPTPEPDEVMEWAWVNPTDLTEAIAAMPFMFSPWMVLQVRLREWEGVFGESPPALTLTKRPRT